MNYAAQRPMNYAAHISSMSSSADILIVDDTIENLRVLSALLTQHGYHVRKATDGEMALLAIQTLRPDLILLDIMLPKIDGYSLCTQLKTNPSTADIPIIFLSALDGEFDKVKAFNVGGADYISKPFQIQEVLVRVRHQLKLNAAEQEIRQLNAELEHRVYERTAQLERANAQLAKVALYDGLTGLVNRILFMETLEREAFKASTEEEYQFAVLFLDCDRFKVINDSLGHLVGDELLVAIAQRLQKLMGTNDTLARLGGDEFAILLPYITHPEQPKRLAQQILTGLSQPFHLQGREVFTSVSIGIAISHASNDSAEHLLRDADTAMYRAKLSGKNQYQVFEGSMHEAAMRRLQLETDLYRAVSNQEFLVYYQPIVSLSTGKLSGFEALVRWNHPQQGLIYPGEFIPLAEETGLIVRLSHWILQQACQQLHQWQCDRLVGEDITMSVNLSGRQFMQPNLINQIEDVLTETGINPACLNLEITESIIIDNGLAAKVLGQLKKYNIKISIDDFGTGYSSLKYLHLLPIDILKIDKSFIQCLDDTSEAVNLVPVILNIAKILDIKVVAEGIETMNQARYLQQLSCQLGQGYLFSKPISLEQMTELLREQTSWLDHQAV